MTKPKIAVIAVLSAAALVTGSLLVRARESAPARERAALDRELNLALGADRGPAPLADIARPEAPPEPETRPAPPPEANPPATDPATPVASRTVPDAPEDVPAPEPVAEERAPEPGRPEAEPEADQPAPENEPASEARAETFTVPAATELRVRLDQTLSTRWNTPGDLFTATLQDPVVDGDRVVIPAGTRLLGEVTEVREPRGDEPGVLKVAFDEITVDGESYPLEATVTTTEAAAPAPDPAPRQPPGESAGSRIGRGALSGALLGRIFGGNTKGALIGAAAGAALGAANGGGSGGRGPGLTALVLAAGSSVSCTLNQPLTIQRIDL
ncbi:MAG: hypothetical protein ACE5HF_09940 [Gemmatimonadota bacterium]